MLADFLSRADANKKVAICGTFYLPFGLICAKLLFVMLDSTGFATLVARKPHLYHAVFEPSESKLDSIRGNGAISVVSRGSSLGSSPA